MCLPAGVYTIYGIAYQYVLSLTLSLTQQWLLLFACQVWLFRVQLLSGAEQVMFRSMTWRLHLTFATFAHSCFAGWFIRPRKTACVACRCVHLSHGVSEIWLHVSLMFVWTLYTFEGLCLPSPSHSCFTGLYQTKEDSVCTVALCPPMSFILEVTSVFMMWSLTVYSIYNKVQSLRLADVGAVNQERQFSVSQSDSLF